MNIDKFQVKKLKNDTAKLFDISPNDIDASKLEQLIEQQRKHLEIAVATRVVDCHRADVPKVT